MAETVKARVIMRRVDPGGLSASDLAHRLAGCIGVKVLDEKPNSILVEGEADILQEASQSIEGWTAYPFARIPIPDVRPRVLKSPKK